MMRVGDLKQDQTIEDVYAWLLDSSKRPFGYGNNMRFKNFLRVVRNYFMKEGRLYKQSVDGQHRLVVLRNKRTHMISAAHDSLGHKMFYATKSLLSQRFWWPGLEEDMYEFVRTCHICQTWQKLKVKIPPVETCTPSIFQVIVTSMHIRPSSELPIIIDPIGLTHITTISDFIGLLTEHYYYVVYLPLMFSIHQFTSI